MFGLKTKAPTDIDGIRVRENTRARRLALRVDARTGEVVLTWPPRATETHARRFILENKNWIERHQKPRKTFSAGQKISLCGNEYEVVRRDGRGVTRIEGKTLIVHGRPEHFSRRLRDFLKKTAMEALSFAAEEKCAVIGKKLKEIRVIDPKSRWGSCAPDGAMMFSWRLILMPPAVMDYIVAHEVAHRVHMNHSRKFWTLCASLTEGAASSRRWLKRNGAEVMAWT